MNIVLVGLGKHAEYVHFPLLIEDSRSVLTHVIDRTSAEGRISKTLEPLGTEQPELLLVPNDDSLLPTLQKELARKLSALIEKNMIDGAVVSTEPLSHLKYVEFFLQRGVSVLVDKPLSTRRLVSSSEDEAKGLEADFQRLSNALRKGRKRNGDCALSIMAYRRYHPAYRAVRTSLLEVAEETGCPVTYCNVEHSDGEWRMPDKLVTQDYHPLKEGYGAFSHSGYHFVDLIEWISRPTFNFGDAVESANINTSFVYPADFIRQLNIDAHQKLVGFQTADTEQSLISQSNLHGEVDATATIEFQSAKGIRSLAIVSIIHSSVSQRTWPSSVGKNLYRGNGRVRHESLSVHQGPLQSLKLRALQSANATEEKIEIPPTQLGGKHHMELVIARNKLLSDCPFETVVDWPGSDDHRKNARRKAIQEFLDILQGGCNEPTSSLESHANSVRLLSGIYRSAARKRAGVSGAVSVSF